ncbi:helix-turn-helix domain-containing protein, partial [Vibrio makurazakiensis]
IDWASVALQFGFSDQPHLVRYLKSQLGLTPNTYAKERGLTIDVYGGVHSE